MSQRMCKLRDAQRLHGKLTSIAAMNEFMLGYRTLGKLLAAFGGDEKGSRLVTGRLKADLKIWRRSLELSGKGLPIAEPGAGPPVNAIKFTSDAAGAAYGWWDGMRVNRSKPGDRRVAAVGFTGGRMWFGAEYRWPYSLLVQDRDELGREFDSKSAVLEEVGLLLPIVTGPEVVQGQHVRLAVDNISLVYGWEKRYMKNERRPPS